MSRQVSNVIHVARWVAALAVLVAHLNANALVYISDIPAQARGPIAYAVWFFYGFAHHAVVVFFVLSGFLVGGGVIRAVHDGGAFLTRYLVDRTTRIYVVLVPVLLTTALLDAVGRRIFADTGAYLDPTFMNRSGLLVLFANLANLQDIFAPYFGTNSALWTLSHEYWYYVTFGLIAASFSRAYGGVMRWVCAGLGITLLLGLSASLSYHLFGFVLWLIGAGAAVARKPLLRSSRQSLAGFAAVAIGLRLFLRYSLVEVWWIGGIADLLVALAFANLLTTLRFDLTRWTICERPLHARLADFSYSLYALHMPVVIFLCAGAQHLFGFGFRSVPYSPSQWLLAAAMLPVVVAFCWLFSLFTEAYTQTVRRALRRYIEGWQGARNRSAAPAASPPQALR
jgi:peptidoglycan/LPS O-acetylase OafA/YrhL